MPPGDPDKGNGAPAREVATDPPANGEAPPDKGPGQRRDLIVEAEEEMRPKVRGPWHGLELDDVEDWA